MAEEKAGRELDAIVAARVMGLCVIKRWAPAMYVEGEWSIHTESSPADSKNDLRRQPVYVESCICDAGPLQAGEDSAHARRGAERVARYNARQRAEYDYNVEMYGHWWQCLRVVPCYSTNIADSWQVVQRWRERGDGFQLDSLGFDGEEWRCGFMDASDGGMQLAFAEAPTAPFAICRAALLAVGAAPSEHGRDGE